LIDFYDAPHAQNKTDFLVIHDPLRHFECEGCGLTRLLPSNFMSDRKTFGLSFPAVKYELIFQSASTSLELSYDSAREGLPHWLFLHGVG
jgi:hypothetical protein